MELQGEITKLELELKETKQKLQELNDKEKLTVEKKIYKKLSDIEIVLSKMECHSNLQVKLTKFMAEMLFDSINLRPNKVYTDHDKYTKRKWQEFQRIVD